MAASLDVLRAAFFPLRELRDRCRGVLATLPAHAGDDDTKTGSTASTSSDAEFSRVVRKEPRDHWARAGVQSVCGALDAALSGRQSSSERGSDQFDGECRIPLVTQHDGTRPQEAERASFDAGLMDLESLEKFLALGEAAESPTVGARLASETLSGVSNVESLAGKNGDISEKSEQLESNAAWELVEDWTPCAIGTLPGWSAAPLSCADY